MKTIWLVVALFLFLALTGCSGKLDYLSIDYIIDVLEDGSENATVRLSVPKSQAEYVVDRLKTELGQQGYWIEAVSSPDSNSFVLEGTRKQALGSWVLPYKPDFVKGDPIFRPTYQDYFFFQTYALDLIYDFDNTAMLEQLKNVRNVNMTYTVNMPGSILASNAHAIKGTSNRWVIDVSKDNNVVLSTKSRVYHPGRFLGAVGIIGVPIWFVVRKKLHMKKQK